MSCHLYGELHGKSWEYNVPLAMHFKMNFYDGGRMAHVPGWLVIRSSNMGKNGKDMFSYPVSFLMIEKSSFFG